MADVEQYTTTVSGEQFTVPTYYSDLAPIASGSYGHVCRTYDTRNKCYMAIKKVKWNPHSEAGVDYCKRILREIRLMIHFHMHDNLLNLADLVMPTTATYDAIYLVSQYIKTDLHTLLAKCPKHFSDENCLSMIYSMLSGLFAMHSAGVMHRDLKPSNILDSDGTVKLADFGLGRDVPQTPGDELTNYVVTRWYRAPEVLLGERYGKVVDVWSLGCIMAEMLAAGHGVASRNEQILFPSRWQQRGAGQGTKEQINMLLDFLGHTPGVSDSWVTAKVPREWLRKQPARKGVDLQERYPKATPEALSLLKDMLTWSPNERPSVQQCLRHEYLGEYAWSDGNEDEVWPKFDGSFALKCKTEHDACLLANLELTRFHPEFAGIQGVEIMEDVSLKTSTETGDTEDMYVDSDQSISGLFEKK
eukprot:TRINITY_DN10181_c0_g1_i2.p1 TRINITY_DN10181_c0_g1~~TRINITY_DN10181_c0_g1_i2.p1  ORF type:complete len:417 (+),score=95.53 TRINITY_DN10181_c0_g1_i2:115-1365(+)